MDWLAVAMPGRFANPVNCKRISIPMVEYLVLAEAAIKASHL